MLTIHTFLLYLHIGLGSVALLLFWLPVCVRKGSTLHNNAGKAFYYIMLVVAGSGILMSSMSIYDPIAIYVTDTSRSQIELQRFLGWRVVFSEFLLLLSVLTWVSVRHAMAVLKAKANRALLKRSQYLIPVLLMLPLAGFVAWQGYRFNQTLLIIFAAVSAYIALSICRYTFKAQVQNREWIIQHFTSMIGTGIGVYTAFFAAGGRRLISDILPEQWMMLSWLAAPMIGVGSILIFKGYFQRKYKVQKNPAKALQLS